MVTHSGILVVITVKWRGNLVTRVLACGTKRGMLQLSTASLAFREIQCFFTPLAQFLQNKLMKLCQRDPKHKPFQILILPRRRE